MKIVDFMVFDDGIEVAENARRCLKCFEVKCWDHFHLRDGKPVARCKECTNGERREKAKLLSLEKRGSKPRLAEGTKHCKKCDTVKPLDDFYIKDKSKNRYQYCCKSCFNSVCSINAAKRYKANPEKHRQMTRDYVAANREEVNRRNRERRLANLEACRERERERESTPQAKARRAEYRRINRERRTKYNADYRRKNYHRTLEYNRWYRAKFPEIYRKATRKWQANNPAKAKLHASSARQNRRARMANIEGSFTPAEWREIKERQNHTCLMCKFREPFIKLTVDHVIPVSKGGTNYASNIQGLCDWCNSVKRNRIIDVNNPPKPRRKPFSRKRKALA